MLSPCPSSLNETTGCPLALPCTGEGDLTAVAAPFPTGEAEAEAEEAAATASSNTRPHSSDISSCSSFSMVANTPNIFFLKKYLANLSERGPPARAPPPHGGGGEGGAHRGLAVVVDGAVPVAVAVAPSPAPAAERAGLGPPNADAQALARGR